MCADGGRTLLLAVTVISGKKSGFDENTFQLWGESPITMCMHGFRGMELQGLFVHICIK
jgi:hypothetical protein